MSGVVHVRPGPGLTAGAGPRRATVRALRLLRYSPPETGRSDRRA